MLRAVYCALPFGAGAVAFGRKLARDAHGMSIKWVCSRSRGRRRHGAAGHRLEAEAQREPMRTREARGEERREERRGEDERAEQEGAERRARTSIEK